MANKMTDAEVMVPAGTTRTGTGNVKAKPSTGTASIKVRRPAPAPSRGSAKKGAGGDTSSGDFGKPVQGLVASAFASKSACKSCSFLYCSVQSTRH